MIFNADDLVAKLGSEKAQEIGEALERLEIKIQSRANPPHPTITVERAVFVIEVEGVEININYDMGLTFPCIGIEQPAFCSFWCGICNELLIAKTIQDINTVDNVQACNRCYDLEQDRLTGGHDISD